MIQSRAGVIQLVIAVLGSLLPIFLQAVGAEPRIAVGAAITPPLTALRHPSRPLKKGEGDGNRTRQRLVVPAQAQP